MTNDFHFGSVGTEPDKGDDVVGQTLAGTEGGFRAAGLGHAGFACEMALGANAVPTLGIELEGVDDLERAIGFAGLDGGDMLLAGTMTALARHCAFAEEFRTTGL